MIVNEIKTGPNYCEHNKLAGPVSIGACVVAINVITSLGVAIAADQANLVSTVAQAAGCGGATFAVMSALFCTASCIYVNRNEKPDPLELGYFA